MRPNYVQQTNKYGGILKFPPTISFGNTVSIPLYLRQADIPVRKQKVTEVNTMPMYDEAYVSDWSSQALFYGGTEPLVATVEGFFLTPTSTVTDPVSGQKLQQLNPTIDGDPHSQTMGFLGMSYGDVIWAYISGKMNQATASMFVRTDPLAYIDPFGNQYNFPIIQQFSCEYTVAINKQTFSLTMYLEG